MIQLRSILQQFIITLVVLTVAMSTVQSFTITTTTTTTSQQMHPVIGRSSHSMRLYSNNEPPRNTERGVSVDQDGKSNVWAIEPKVEIEQKSNEEQSTSAFIAFGGLVVCGVAAALILTNLPDPNQF